MKNYTITVNGNVYDVVVEEGASTGAAPVAAAAPKAAPKAILHSVCSTSDCLIDHNFINKFVQYGWCQFIKCHVLLNKLHKYIHIRFLSTHAL